MTFSLDYSLAKELFTRERIPAVRYLKESFKVMGCVPDLRTCRDIVDHVQAGTVQIMDWGLGEKSILVRLGEQ